MGWLKNNVAVIVVGDVTLFNIIFVCYAKCQRQEGSIPRQVNGKVIGIIQIIVRRTCADYMPIAVAALL